MRVIIRTICVTASLMALVACGDGRGSPYSSARAQAPTPTYIPVTPGAKPIDAAPAVLTTPIPVTPGAVPITPAVVVTGGSRLAPSASLTPVPRGGGAAITTVAAAPTRTRAGVPYSRGRIYDACREAGRKEATDRRCGCVQSAANQTLNQSQQRRGADYFSNQQALQDIRQSNTAANERFWKDWKAFGDAASRICKGS